MSKKLILFYSLEGSSKMIGEYLARELDIPYEEIRVIDDIKKKGVGKYTIGGDLVKGRETPKYHPLKVNLDEYDTIIMGSPIWNGSYAPVIRTILEDETIVGKNIGFYYTHEGNLADAENNINAKVNRNNKYLGSYGILNPKDNFEKEKEAFLEWARNIE